MGQLSPKDVFKLLQTAANAKDVPTIEKWLQTKHNYFVTRSIIYQWKHGSIQGFRAANKEILGKILNLDPATLVSPKTGKLINKTDRPLTLTMQFLGCIRNPDWIGRYK